MSRKTRHDEGGLLSLGILARSVEVVMVDRGGCTRNIRLSQVGLSSDLSRGKGERKEKKPARCRKITKGEREINNRQG
jgi:hypothetical protein